ncbi:Sodium/hydrogen exchanger 10 [Bonamia ostreae]|uniref:Sodium/hydrogen exchanger 10 n=1 Tax=Bonamia ostreae TaxID=126728 RepID=A0ABV2AEJ2_9EUKA
MSLSSDSSWLFVAFIGMLIGVIVYHLNKKFHNKIPFSVILLLVGVSIGGIDIALKRKVPFIDIIETLNPMIFMQIFLPNLIFYSVFSTNHHTLMRVKWHALVLAIPGVLINTLLTSIICSYILPYRWNIKISLLFGSIVSATDPVAVVTLLREIKASQNLSTVVETESLFNDASAIILFDVLTLMIIDSQKSKTASFYIFRCLVLLSGSLIGAIFGFITSLYITTVLNDELLETSATFIGINLDFIVADLLKSSGVLATVAMGLVIARNKARFSTRVWVIIKGPCKLEPLLGAARVFLEVPHFSDLGDHRLLQDDQRKQRVVA